MYWLDVTAHTARRGGSSRLGVDIPTEYPLKTVVSQGRFFCFMLMWLTHSTELWNKRCLLPRQQGGSLLPVYSRDTWTIISHFSGSQHTNCGFVFDIQSVASFTSLSFNHDTVILESRKRSTTSWRNCHANVGCRLSQKQTRSLSTGFRDRFFLYANWVILKSPFF